MLNTIRIATFQNYSVLKCASSLSRVMEKQQIVQNLKSVDKKALSDSLSGEIKCRFLFMSSTLGRQDATI